MANKALKNQQKSLAAEIVSSIETKLGEAGDASKKVKKSVEKSADKLAKKLTKLMHKAEKKAAKPGKKSKKDDTKSKKNGLKSAKADQYAAAPSTNTIADSVTTDLSKPAVASGKSRLKPTPSAAPALSETATENA